MSTRLLHAWQRGRFWLSGLLLVLPCWYLWQSFNPVFPAEWPERQAGPFAVAVTPADDAPPYRHDDARQMDFSARFCDGCVAKIRMAWLSVGAQPAPLPDDLAGVLHGDSRMQHAHAPVPRASAPQDRLWLTVESWDGKVHHADWPLPENWR
jgi:hypothetical protein